LLLRSFTEKFEGIPLAQIQLHSLLLASQVMGYIRKCPDALGRLQGACQRWGL
jgi:hypothetical protein